MTLQIALRPRACALAVALSLAMPFGVAADLEAGFKTPPNAAKPRLWWHWINGNVSQPGIKLDLEWMQRIGVGGVQLIDADIGTAQYVDERVGFMTPRWLGSVKYAATLADQLGLEMTMAASSGWSETGGPSVTPAQAMKKYVWAETRVDGPRRFSGRLTAPPSVSGPFQNVPFLSVFSSMPPPDGSPGAKPYVKKQFEPPQLYVDAAVIAYRLPDAEREAAAPTVTSSGTIDGARLADGDYATSQRLAIPVGVGDPAWIELAYPQPVRMQSVTLALGSSMVPDGVIKVSLDGVHYQVVATLPGSSHDLSVVSGVHTYAFAEQSARFVRLELGAPKRGPYDDAIGKPLVTFHSIAEFSVGGAARVNRFEEKAGFSIAKEYDSIRTPAVALDMAVASASVVDLTGRMGADGSLDWEVPAGRWAILRLGYSLTGQHNDPATQEGIGLEVDKLNGAHVRAYIGTFLAPLEATLGPLIGARGVSHLLLDSFEANQQNWTEDMLGEFRRRRGYDPVPYLGVLTGRVVDSADASDKFLWDFRRTVADLLAENHYGVIADEAHKRGMKVYGEAMGVNLPTVGDGLQSKGKMDIPMGEFWDRQEREKPVPNQVSDIREAASAAHIYGKNLVAAESFTALPMLAPWSHGPGNLKWLADQNMALGVNRFALHASVHQPFEDRKPGVSLWRFGQHFTRNDTWAEQAGPWIGYLGRASYLLQQGRAVNDIAYFYGEGAPVAAPFGEPDRPTIPDGYGYDYVNAEVLLDKMTVRDGRLELPGGASYRLLVLPATLERISVPLLRKLRALVEAGAVMVAPKPLGTPGIGDSAEVATIAAALWGDADGRTVTEHRYGKGKVVWGQDVRAVLDGLALAPDYAFNRPHFDTSIVATHRSSSDGEIYFVANQRRRAERIEASFRVTGLRPELWYADTGTTAPASYRMEDGRTIVSLDMEAHGSVFVVFRAPTTTRQVTLPNRQSRVLATLAGPWKLAFAPGWGAPASVQFAQLASWSDSPIEGVRHFSGTATYRRTLQADAAWFGKGKRLRLDLGEVHEIAEVLVNGHAVTTLWKQPYSVEVGAWLRPGSNSVELRVTNLWPNRLIGDAQPGAKPFTFSTFKAYGPDATLLPSGLLGPVRVLLETDAP